MEMLSRMRAFIALRALARVALLLLLVLGMGVDAGAQSPSPQQLRAQQNPVGTEVTVASPHWEGLRWEVAHAFRAWHKAKYGTEATVRYLDIGGGSAIVRYLTSNSAAAAGIDVMFGGGTDPFITLAKAGILMPVQLPPEVLAAIPPDLFGVPLRDPDGYWFGTYVTSFGILSNEKIRAWAHLPEAHTWKDLTNPRLRSWVSSGDPRQSGSILFMCEIILQAYGWEKGWEVILGMSGNVRSFLKSASSSIKEATFGEAAFALGIDSYGLSQVAYLGREHARFILPRELTVFSADSVAVLKAAAEPVLAQRFVEFTLSREGQRLLLLPRGAPGGAVRYDINRMVVIPALYGEVGEGSPVKINPFLQQLGFKYNSRKGSERRAVLAVLLGAWVIDMHTELKDAWAAIHALPPERAELKARLLAELLQPPLSEEEALNLGRRTLIPPGAGGGKAASLSRWDSPVLRNQLILQWQREAATRYKTMLQKAREGL